MYKWILRGRSRTRRDRKLGNAKSTLCHTKRVRVDAFVIMFERSIGRETVLLCIKRKWRGSDESERERDKTRERDGDEVCVFMRTSTTDKLERVNCKIWHEFILDYGVHRNFSMWTASTISNLCNPLKYLYSSSSGHTSEIHFVFLPPKLWVLED